MRVIGLLAYMAAALVWMTEQPVLAFIAVLLAGWVGVLTLLQHRLVLNPGPWNESHTIELSLVSLPSMTIALAMFGPLLLSWGLLPQ